MNSSNHALTRAENETIENRSGQQLITQPVPMWTTGGVQRAGNIAAYLEIPFLHKRLIMGCTLIGMLCGWLAIVAWPRTYESEAKLMIRVGRESVSLDPTATTSATLMLQKTQEEEVISALEVLNSRQVAETVVGDLGAQAILSGELPGGAPAETTRTGEIVTSVKSAVADWLYRVSRTAGIKDDIGDRELAIRKLQKAVRIYSPRKSNVIIIAAKAKTPKMAQAIVSEVTKSFLDEHLQAAHTSGSREFFEKQSAAVESQLDQLVAQRSKFMQENKIVSIDSNRELLEQQLTGIDRDLVLASGELQQAISEIEDLKSKVSVTDDEIVAMKSDSTWSGMRQRVYNLELDELRLSAIYPPDHPKLKAVRQELEGAQKILAEMKSERMDESTTPNPAIMRLREELQKQQTRVVGLRSMIEQKQEQRVQLEKQAHELLEHERQLIQSDREIRLTDASLLVLREKLEEARVIDGLHSEKISNVHTFQPATLVEKAVSPKKPILAAGFLLLGLMTGLGLSLLRQSTSPFLRTTEDVEFELGIPAIASIPRLRPMHSLSLRKRKPYRERCQALIAEILLSQGRPRQTRGRSIAILGVDAGAGASSLAANLALSSSLDFRLKTVLVDADTRRRSVSKMFGLNGSPGLVELVNGSASHDECLQRAKNAPVDLIASASSSSEEILTSGAPEIVQALQACQHDCDLLIVDLPAASQPDQAIALAQHLDCVLLVIESEKTRTEAADRLLRRLAESNTEVIGVVLNKTRSYVPRLLRRFVAPR